MLALIIHLMSLVCMQGNLSTAVLWQQTQPSKPVQRSVVKADERKLPAEAEKALAAADHRAQQYLAEVERLYRKFFLDVRTDDNLEPFVSELLSFTEKFRMGSDLVNGRSSYQQQRVRALFRDIIFDDEEMSKVFGDVVEQFSRLLTEEDKALLIWLKIDCDIPASKFSRNDVDITEFRRHIVAVIDSSVSAAQMDVARFAATIAASEAIGQGARQVGREMGVLPEDENSIEGILAGLLVDIAVGIAIDHITDPTDKVIEQLQSELRAADAAILNGTDQQPGLLRVLRKAAADRQTARRQVLLNHYFK